MLPYPCAVGRGKLLCRQGSGGTGFINRHTLPVSDLRGKREGGKQLGIPFVGGDQSELYAAFEYPRHHTNPRFGKLDDMRAVDPGHFSDDQEHAHGNTDRKRDPRQPDIFSGTADPALEYQHDDRRRVKKILPGGYDIKQRRAGIFPVPVDKARSETKYQPVQIVRDHQQNEHGGDRRHPKPFFRDALIAFRRNGKRNIKEKERKQEHRHIIKIPCMPR